MSGGSETTTTVFWDVEDFPVDNVDEIGPKIKIALEKIGYRGDVSIKAYGYQKDDDELDRYKDAGITFLPIGGEKKKKDDRKDDRVCRMMLDIGIWMLDYSLSFIKPNLMVISEFVPGKNIFPHFLEDLHEDLDFNVILVLPFNCISKKMFVPHLTTMWYWDSILNGGEPLSEHSLACLLARGGRLPSCLLDNHFDLSICLGCQQDKY